MTPQSRAQLSLPETARRTDHGRPTSGQIRARLAGINWGHVGLALSIYLAARLTSALMMKKIADGLTSQPAYLASATNWDGQWYKTIATHGYRTAASLFEPVTQQNEIAFYPVYPYLCRLLSTAFNVPFEVVAVTLSLAAGALASVSLFTWLLKFQPQWAAGTSIAVLAFFPSAPAFQIAYTEGLAAFLIVVALRALDARRYVLLGCVILVLAFTRPILPPLGLLVALHVLSEYRRLGSPPLRSREMAGPLTVLLVAAIGCLAWPLTAWWMTGVPQAYFATMGTWVRYGGIKGGWVGGLWQAGMPAAAVALGGILASLVVIRVRRALSGTAPALIHQWAGVYALFILLSTTISTSVFRYGLLLLAPVDWTTLSRARRLRWYVLGMVLLFEVALQYVWLKTYLVIEPSHRLQSPP